MNKSSCLATGYYYNVTFVQLGLFDLGSPLIGMSEQAVATCIACFALFTCIIALVFGMLMQKRGWSQQFIFKLRIACGIVLIQTILTGIALFIRNAPLFFAWIVITSSTIGIGVPVPSSLAMDLIPVRASILLVYSVYELMLHPRTQTTIGMASHFSAGNIRVICDQCVMETLRTVSIM